MNIYELYERELKKHNPKTMNLPKSEIKVKQEQELKDNIKKLLLSSIKAMFLWGLETTENIPTEKCDLLKKSINDELRRNCYNSNIRILISTYQIDCNASDDSFSFKPEKPFSDLDYCEFQKKTNCFLCISLCPSTKKSFRLHVWDNDNINGGRLAKKLLREVIYDLNDVKIIKIDPLGVCDVVEIDIDKLFHQKNS